MALSLIIWPVLNIYSQGEGFNPEVLKTKYGQFSLGNLGYSSVQCVSVPYGMDKAVVSCPYG